MDGKLDSGILSNDASKPLETCGSDPGPSMGDDMAADPAGGELRLRHDMHMRGSSAPVSGSASPRKEGSDPGAGSGGGTPVAKGSQTDNADEVAHLKEREGYDMIMAGVFLTSVSVGANLLNVPQSMAHMGWLAVPTILVLGVQSCFCSCLLASCWEIVEKLDPELSGPVRKPYPRIVQRALGHCARYLTSLIVLILDTLCAVMLVVLASDLVTSIVNYAYPDAKPTICFMTVMLAVFLSPFTWFNSPKNFWMIAVIGLTTTLIAWLLMLMKVCADHCNRATPPLRLPPPPLHMMVGLSGICNCFTTGGVQPSIQADMRNRRDFSSAVIGVWVVISVMMLSFATTSYTLVGSEVKSNILHNLGSGKFLLAIQMTMLTHVLTSFIIYINPLYQELEETFNITAGGWRQYLFRTVCMALLLLVSEATPDFGSVLDIISVLAIVTTLVMPPFLYLRLTRMEGVDINLNFFEQAFLVFLIVTGLVYMVVAAYGTAAYVFAEQKQGTCFSPHASQNLSTNMSNTTPANRALIFQAQILTLKPPT